MGVLVSLLSGGGGDCVVGYWLDYLNKYKAYYSRTQSLLATNSSHWGTYLWVTFDSSTTIYQSPGPGTWQYDSLDLICDCFPNLSFVYIIQWALTAYVPT